MPDPLGLTLPTLPSIPGYGQVNSPVTPMPGTDPSPIPGDPTPDLPADPGLFSRVGNFVSLPGFAVRNLMMGEPEAAGRNLADFLGDIPSAIPGVGPMIPSLSTQSDKPDFSDVTGGMEPGLLRSATNFVGNALTDPLSYVPGEWVGAGLGAVGKGIGAGMSVLDQHAPKAAEMLRGAYYGTKSTVGYLTPETEAGAKTRQEAQAAKQSAANAADQANLQLPGGTDEGIRTQASSILENMKQNPDGSWSQIVPDSHIPNAQRDLGEQLAARNGPIPSDAATPPGPGSYELQRRTDIPQTPDLDTALGARGVADRAPGVSDPGVNALQENTLGSYPSKPFGPGATQEPDATSRMLGTTKGTVRDPIDYPPEAFTPEGMSPEDTANIRKGKPTPINELMDVPPGEMQQPTQVKYPEMGVTGKQLGTNRVPLNADQPSAVEQVAGTKIAGTDPFTGAPTFSNVQPKVTVPVAANTLEAMNALQGGRAAEVAMMAKKEAPPSAQTSVTKDQQMALIDDRLKARIADGTLTPERAADLRKYLDAYTDLSRNLYKDGVKKGVFYHPVGEDIERYAPVDYSPRKYMDTLSPQDRAILESDERFQSSFLGNEPSAVKGRTIGHGQDLVDAMNSPAMKGVKLEADAGLNMARRAQQQGTLSGQAVIARDLLGDKFGPGGEYASLASPGTRKAVNDIIDNMEKQYPEQARLMRYSFNGLGQRSKFMQALNTMAAPFKRSAVYGILIPQAGHITRNILSHPFQYGFQGHGQLAVNQALRTPATVWHAMKIGLHKSFGWDMPYDALEGKMNAVEDALKNSQGSDLQAIAGLRAQGDEASAQALKWGVGQGFVSQEVMLDKLGKQGWTRRLMTSIGVGKKLQDRAMNMMDAPEEAFRGEEQYARFGAFHDNYAKYTGQGMAPDLAGQKAAKDVSDSLYDYNAYTPGNRTLRTIIPFAAFQTNAIRQTAGAFARYPALATAVGNAMQQNPNNPEYPYMAGKTNVPIGLDEKGNPQYISQIGIPMEALNTIPNYSSGLRTFGDQAESNIVGSMNPLIKTAYEVLAGHDPFFKTPMGSYDKVPLLGHAGAFGQAYNTLEGTGLIQPLTSPLTQLEHMTDDRHSLATRLLNTFTGANIVSVDPKVAEQQTLQKALSLDPNVTQYIRFQPTNGDTQAKGLINQMNKARSAVAAEKKADQPATSPTSPAPAKEGSSTALKDRFPRPRSRTIPKPADATNGRQQPASAPAGALPLQ